MALRGALVLLIVAGPLIAPAISPSEDFVAVVHASNSVEELSHRDLRQIYWMTRREWPSGELISPYLPPEGSPEEELLRVKIFQVRSSVEISKYYLRAIFRQQIASPPERALTPFHAVSRVAADPGAIALARRNRVSGSPGVRLIQIQR